MNEILMRVVLDLAAFLELTDDSHVDPRLAVKQLESVAFSLQQLRSEDRETFLAFVEQRAAEETDPLYRRFLLDFPEALGLSGEEN
jgi:hypothetical protein